VGRGSLGSNSTGQKNTGFGWKAGDSITTGSNLTCIGYDAEPTAVDATNEFTLGDANVATLRCNTQSISALSDIRDKTNINKLDVGINFIKELNPVTFDWNRRDGTMQGKKGAGFIAQELDDLQNKYKAGDTLDIVLKTNPEKLEAAQGKLIPVLVKAVQELTQKVEDQEKEIKELKDGK